MDRSSLLAKLLVVGVVAGVGLTAAALVRGNDDSTTAAPAASPAAKDPKLVLRRPWLDRLPTKRTDDFDLWFFFGSGFAIHERGSTYRSTLEILDFERRKDALDMVFLQDKKKQTVRFSVVECHDKPEFDLCLDVDPPLAGKKRLYSWGDDADMDAKMPWARERRTAAEAFARSAH